MKDPLKSSSRHARAWARRFSRDDDDCPGLEACAGLALGLGVLGPPRPAEGGAEAGWRASMLCCVGAVGGVSRTVMPHLRKRGGRKQSSEEKETPGQRRENGAALDNTRGRA